MSMIGKSLAHYSITSQLGKGGMGEVYQAKDQKLARDVAIKVLPEEFAKDTDRIARFQREAKLLASLNHPNIAAIYGLEEADGTHFLVLELVEGQTLAERIQTGPMDVEEALKLGLQITEALEAAHEKGVIHRDLKPANIKVTPDGKVKVLDFGLAKAFAGDHVEVNLSQSPTLSEAATMQGVILGTAAYMSPEQARGKEVDKRADIWAFGVVLFEMLTGKSLFSGEDVSSTLARVLEREPDFSKLPKNLHPKIVEMFKRCLEKDPQNRYSGISDARVDIQKVLADPSGVFATPITVVEHQTGIRTILPWIAVLTLVGIIIGAAVWKLKPSEPGQITRLDVVFPEYLRVGEYLLSPDGRTVAIAASPRNPEKPEDDIYRLYTRKLESTDWKLLPRSENGVDFFTFSPDSQRLATLIPVEPRSNDLQLWKVSLDGKTPPQALARWADDWNTPFLWLPDDDLIALTRNQEIVRIPTDSSLPQTPVPIRKDGFTDNVFLTFGGQSILPDGRHVLGQVSNFSEEGYRIDTVILDIETGDARIVYPNAGSPRWSPTGHLLFSRVDTVYAIRFDPVDLVPAGEPVAITDGLYTSNAWAHGRLDLTQRGDLIHRPGGLVGQSRQVNWGDGDTYKLMEPWSKDLRPFTGESGFGGGIKVSRDGSHLVVHIPDSGGIFDCWLSEVQPPGLRPFIDQPGWDCNAVCFTPDSQELIYSLSTGSISQIYKGRVDRSGEPDLLFESSSTTGHFFPNTLTKDGRHLIMTHRRSDGSSDLVLLPLESGQDDSRNTRVLIEDARFGSVSPDDRLLLYQSEASGKWEWWVRTISRDGDLGRELQLTTDGGTVGWRKPLLENVSWELNHFYKGSVYRITITLDSVLRETGRKLIGEWSWDVLAGAQMTDGRFLVITRGDDEVKEFTSVTMVLNWVTELRQRLATSVQ